MADLVLPKPGDRALSARQPYPDLILAGEKDVENRAWRVPSTLPQWVACELCGEFTLEADDWQCSTCGIGSPAADCGPFPFRLWIHAAAKASEDSAAWLAWERSEWTATLPWPELAQCGVLLGTVEVTGCHHARDCYSGFHGLPLDPHGVHDSWCSRWAQPDAWHWTLANPQPLEQPIPAKGALGLWRIPEGLVAAHG